MPGVGPQRGRLLIGVVAGLLASVLAGFATAQAIKSTLGVTFRDKTPLAAPPAAVPQRSGGDLLPPTAVVPAVSLPSGGLDDPLLALAADQLAGALTDRLGGPAVVGEDLAAAGVVAVLDASAPLGPESFERGGAPVTITAADRRGLAAGMFRLAQDLQAGHPWAQASAAAVVTPAAAHRFVDSGAVGIPDDPGAWRAQDDYSHVSGALSQVILDTEPWVDAAALAEVDVQWRAYVDHVVAYGYNGIVVPGFLEYVTFSGVGDGTTVYPVGSAYITRAQALRQQVGRMWSYADTMGLDVVVVTDMLALSRPLEEHLTAEIGSVDAADPRLWDVYSAGLDELLTELPFLDGIMLRIGEGGGIYNAEGWDYYSRLAVTRTPQVQAMLRALSTTAARHDADVYFRTWSVGVGDVGDLHTNPETYERVLGGLAPDNLVVSTKFVAGDFDSYLPFNPTLGVGEQQRMVELQARREFEAFSAFPNPVGADHQLALQRVRDSGRLSGVWVWTQSGGPLRAGPRSLYLREGDWQLWDLDVWTTARLAWDPDADVGGLQADWVAANWTADPQARDALVELLGRGRQATLAGLYVGPYAERDVRAFGLELPPMMWLFKWDLVSGDSATWSALYAASAGRIDEAVAEGDAAVALVAGMQTSLDEIPAAAFRDPGVRDDLAASLAYQRDMFTVLAAYRATMLRYYEWLDTGSAEARAAHREARERFETARVAHVERWRGDLDHPPLVFDNAAAGLAVMSRDPATAWLARGLLVAVVLALILFSGARRAVVVPWRVARPVGRSQAGLLAALALACWVVVHGGVSGTAGPYLATAAGAAAAFALGYLATVLLTGGRGGVGRAAVALAGATVLSAVPLLAALALRGTTGAWSGFWVDADARLVFVVAHVAGLVWTGGVLAVTAARLAPNAVRAVIASGATLAGGGLLAASIGAVTGAVGMERYLTTLNDDMAVIPFGLSRILGITVHLGVPPALSGWLLAGGATVAAAVLVASAGSAVVAGVGRSARPG